MATVVRGSATRAASDGFRGVVKIKPVAGTVAATNDAQRPTPNALPNHRSLITNHLSQYSSLIRSPGFESQWVEARVPPPESGHEVILACLPAGSAPFADQ
jgi:hypothetical protein